MVFLKTTWYSAYVNFMIFANFPFVLYNSQEVTQVPVVSISDKTSDNNRGRRCRNLDTCLSVLQAWLLPVQSLRVDKKKLKDLMAFFAIFYNFFHWSWVTAEKMGGGGHKFLNTLSLFFFSNKTPCNGWK